MNKKELRIAMKVKRINIKNKNFKTQQLFTHLQELLSTLKYSIIGYYYPYENEINIMEHLLKFKKVLVFPFIENKEMIFIEEKMGKMKTSIGVFQPLKKNNQREVIPDIILLPAIAMNKFGFRLGYGGGFYDKYLSRNEQVLTIALVFEEQILEEQFEEEFDVPVDFIISDKAIYKIKKC